MQTSDAVLMGTPLYMSPEQALGHNSDVTAQSDVFSLGSMAYECLTGSAPFAADTVAKVVFRIAYEPHPPLRNRLPGIDASVEQAIEHALQKDRAKRTATVAVFVLEFTGEVLTSASQSPVRNVSGGLLTPGMAVDEQMMSSATAAPSQGAARATPARQSDGPAVVPPSARRLGVLALALGAVVVGGSLAAWVIARTTTSLSHDSTGDSTSELRARAVVDSGASADALVTVASDSGAAPVPLPADRGGDHQADAGTAPKPIPAPPPSKSDRALLAPLEEQVKKGQADAVWNARIGTEARLNSSGGLREYAVLMVEVACARKDVGAANMFFRKLESAGPRDAARKRCRKHADFELSY
jgi:serine/threonine-protein kinase